MFERARLKLTAWYLLIIMLVSGLFSLMIYTNINREFARIENFQRSRQAERRILRLPPDPELIKEARERIISFLVLVNLAIFGIAGLAGYLLAGKTLKPIKDMVDEQGRFISDAAHELRTPLTSLKSEIEVNLRDKDLNLKDAKKLLESNLEEVNRLQYLSDNLLTLAKYQKGEQLFLEKLSLKEIIHEAIKKTAIMAKSKGIKIEDRVNDYFIEGDKQKLIETFVIFLDNAIKYSHKNSRVILESFKFNQYVEIKIIDQGMGIGQKDLPFIFDRFYRADTSRSKTSTEGYGLGLSIAKQTIKEHEGNIKVESTLKKGTTFSIFLPATF